MNISNRLIFYDSKPSNPITGDSYYDIITKLYLVYDGNKWVSMLSQNYFTKQKHTLFDTIFEMDRVLNGSETFILSKLESGEIRPNDKELSSVFSTDLWEKIEPILLLKNRINRIKKILK